MGLPHSAAPQAVRGEAPHSRNFSSDLEVNWHLSSYKYMLHVHA